MPKGKCNGSRVKDTSRSRGKNPVFSDEDDIGEHIGEHEEELDENFEWMKL